MKLKPKTTLPPLSRFADIVRNTRINKGLAQKDAAKLLHISVGVLQLLETGPKHLPDADLFRRVVEGLETDPLELLRADGFISGGDCAAGGVGR